MPNLLAAGSNENLHVAIEQVQKAHQLFNGEEIKAIVREGRHPFREGNGRAQLAFIDLVADRAGLPLDLSRIQPAPFLSAMIASFSGDVQALREELASLRA
jgi:fido (protein-threonine AMPylation protein)